MCYTRRKIEGGVGALRESDDANFLKPNGQSRNLNIYVFDSPITNDEFHWPNNKKKIDLYQTSEVHRT